MNLSKNQNRSVGWILALAGLLSGAVHASGVCTPPRYHVERTLVDNTSDVHVHISIRLEDFAPERLICLAEALRQKYPVRDRLSAFIFSSRDAARNFVPPVEQTAMTYYNDSKFHASYVYDRGRNEDYLFIVPDGHRDQTDSPFNTRINLPATGTPVCRLAMNGRCLLEFEHIYDSPISRSSVAHGIQGQVSLSASIGENGVLTKVIVVDAKADSPEQRSTLADWATRNIRTWRFEPSKHEDEVRLTYYFEVTDSPVKDEDSVQFHLPVEVRVKTMRKH